MSNLVLKLNGVVYDLSPVDDGTAENADLVLADENGNNVAVFQDGNIKTKNFDSSGFLIYPLTERGGFNSGGIEDYSISSFDTFVRTAFFIKTGGAKYVRLENEGGVLQYDADHHFISSDYISVGNVLLDDNCVFVRFYTNKDVTTRIKLVFCGGTIPPEETKRVQMQSPSDRIVYAVDENICTTARLKLPTNYTIDGKKVPLVIWDSGDGSFNTWNKEMGAPGYEGRVNGLNYLCDQGFAVLEIFSWGSYLYQNYPGCGNRSAMPIPTHLATHEKGVEYVLSRYNIDPENIFHISKSGSGKIALFYALQKPSFNLRSIYAMAPVFDDLNFPGWGMRDYRLALYEELNMRGEKDTEGTPAYQFLNGTPVADGGYDGSGWVPQSAKGVQFITDNADKFTFAVPGWMNLCGQTISEKMADTTNFALLFWEGCHYNSQTDTWEWTEKLPATRGDVCYTRDGLVMVGNHIPFTVIMSPTDGQTPYWDALEVVKQLLNGGNDASMVTLADGGHSGPDLSTSGANYVADITTRLGVHYDGVSIGWYLAVEDIYARFLK